MPNQIPLPQTLTARTTVETLLQALRDYKEIEGPHKALLVTVAADPKDVRRAALQTHEGKPVLTLKGAKLERIILPPEQGGGLRLCLTLTTSDK